MSLKKPRKLTQLAITYAPINKSLLGSFTKPNWEAIAFFWYWADRTLTSNQNTASVGSAMIK